MTLAEWVRQALDRARLRQPLGSVEKKLAAIRSARVTNRPPPTSTPCWPKLIADTPPVSLGDSHRLQHTYAHFDLRHRLRWFPQDHETLIARCNKPCAASLGSPASSTPRPHSSGSSSIPAPNIGARARTPPTKSFCRLDRDVGAKRSPNRTLAPRPALRKPLALDSRRTLFCAGLILYKLSHAHFTLAPTRRIARDAQRSWRATPDHRRHSRPRPPSRLPRHLCEMLAWAWPLDWLSAGP